jgi:hypothetical protein
MPKTVTLKLVTPMMVHGTPLTEVVLREPSFNEYLEIGDPFTVAASPGSGVPFIVEDLEVVRKYVRLLVMPPADALALEQGGFDLARRMKDAVMGFFRRGEEADAASPTLPTT